MTSVSIVKIAALASVFIAAGSAALIFGVAHVPHEERLAADAVTTSVPQAAPAVRSDAPLAATGTPAALAAIEANSAAIAAELAGPPNAAGKDQSSLAFDIVCVETVATRSSPDGRLRARL